MGRTGSSGRSGWDTPKWYKSQEDEPNFRMLFFLFWEEHVFPVAHMGVSPKGGSPVSGLWVGALCEILRGFSIWDF